MFSIATISTELGESVCKIVSEITLVYRPIQRSPDGEITHFRHQKEIVTNTNVFRS